MIDHNFINEYHHCEYCEYLFHPTRCSSCSVDTDNSAMEDLWVESTDVDRRLRILNQYGYQELSKYLNNLRRSNDY